MSTITPMTAEEYAKTNHYAIGMNPSGAQGRTVAALKEREALLGRVSELEGELERAAAAAAFRQGVLEQLYNQADALTRVGLIVSRIAEHPMADRVYFCAFSDNHTVIASGPLDEKSLTRCLALLDARQPLEKEAPAYSSVRQAMAVEYAGLIEAQLHEAELRRMKAEADIAALKLKRMEGLPA